MISGAQAVTPQPTTLANGFSPNSLTIFSLATTFAAAPSAIPEAFPAVTTPPFLNAAGRRARDSSVVCERGCSSLVRWREASFRVGVGTEVRCWEL